VSEQENTPQTSLVHSAYRAPEGFEAFPVGIHHASTVVFPDVATMRSRDWREKLGYTYGLHGTPTSFVLEARLAEIEGGNYCRVTPSGLAAIVMINFALLKAGDEVLLPDNVYGPSKDLSHWLQSDFNITARFYDPMIGAGLADLITPATRLVWTEAPGSVSMEVPDIPALCEAAHARGVLVAIDNTWSAGLAFNAFEHGVDIVMQALTKYQSGGSDVLMGAVIVRDKALNERLELAHARLGFGVGMDDVYLVLRSLASMRLRFNAHDAAAREVARWLKTRPEIAAVLHPAFEDCPGHAFWKRDFTGAGGLFSVIFQPHFNERQTDLFVDSLRLFKIGYSWGGAHSLCVPYRMDGMRQGWQRQGQLVRFNIGLESPQDLIRDIEAALRVMQAE
jgi:cystathionine beta-lyase